MNSVAQIITVTALNLRNLPQRLGSSLVIVIGIAGVVGVLISMLSMSVGFRQATTSGAQEDRAIVMTRGAERENMSAVSRADVIALDNLPGVRRTADGKPAISAEVIALAPVARKSDASDAFVAVRGVGAATFAVRSELRIIEGRMFRPAEREVLVGRAARAQFANLNPGDTLAMGDGDWTVVGVFEAQGSFHESTLIADADAVLSAFRRKSFNSVTVLLDSKSSFVAFQQSLAAIMRHQGAEPPIPSGCRSRSAPLSPGRLCRAPGA